ncbi:hypothetical protein [Photobacterium rosenbergii]|uniref:hypothetical protein n=1 Tax=Photobacterium rosenbergii TaxID=294936 RepID=UPI001C9A04A7|nr:hypothetical protein [Photobacterium rosenbergii]MBY5948411.1 hypothetical protein [Photobacterium rosenbergii]
MEIHIFKSKSLGVFFATAAQGIQGRAGKRAIERAMSYIGSTDGLETLLRADDLEHEVISTSIFGENRSVFRQLRHKEGLMMIGATSRIEVSRLISYSGERMQLNES